MRSKLTLTVGLVLAAAGGLISFATLRGRTPPAPGDRVVVLYAAKPIPSGTTGANAVSQGLIGTKSVPSGTRPDNALNGVSELSGRSAAQNLDPGTVLTTDRFPPVQTRIGSVRIPPGKTALALLLENVPGLAGYAGAGDKIDIFGVSKEGPSGSDVRLILQNIDVLSVNGEAMAPAQGKPDGPGSVFLLSVSPAEAERLIFLTSFGQLYFSLVARDQAPVASTPGATADDVLGSR